MRRSLNLIVAVALAVSPVAAAEKASAPDPIRLLDAAYAGPSFSYQGRVILTQWTGKQNRAEEVNVFFAPPNKYRLEFLAPDGTVDRIVVGDGQREQVQLIKQGKILAGYATQISPRFLNREEERRLLLTNYNVTVTGAENVLGRSAWVLDMSPSVEGKPRQRMWIDKDTNAVLEVKRDASTGGAASRFTRFEKKSLPESLFGQDSSIVTMDMGKPAENVEEAKRLMGASADQSKLEGGFALMGADMFDVKGEPVRHLRYTDGLLPVSLFVTRVPVDAPKTENLAQPQTTPLYFGLSSPVNVSQWKSGKDHYTIVGEVEPSLLKEMSAPVR